MSDDDVKGRIKYLERYKQLISYEGLKRRRNITPTDIDGFIDYNGINFVYIEGKLVDKEIDCGQRKALEHAVDSHTSAGHRSCAIIFRHNEPPENIIMAKDKPVSDIYYDREWREPKQKGITVLGFIELWENYWDKLKFDI